MTSTYYCPAFAQLRDQQVRFAPRDKKVEQINRAERLLSEIDQGREYSYEYLEFRITDYRPETTPHVTVNGKEVIHDLRMFVEDVSDAANIQAEDAGEPVHTVDDLSKLFNVSTKTISRWRDQGLVSRRFVFDGRKRVGFLRSSVERFVAQNRNRVQRGQNFSQMTEEERQEIVHKARRLSRAGTCPSEVARRVARQMNRSMEAVRYTLRQFDKDHPEIAVFPDQTGALTSRLKQEIYQAYRLGESVDALTQKYSRTRTRIYRIINEVRSARVAELNLDFIPNENFEKVDAKEEKIVLGPMPEVESATRKARSPAGLPPYLAALYEVPLLTREQEYHLFRMFNYLKFKASQLRDAIDPARAKSSDLDQVESLYEEAVKVKNRLVQANLRLVVSIAKRHLGSNDDFFALVSDGNMSLIRAVEKFDFARGNKFSTYASWSIMKNYARSIPDEFKHRDRFRTSPEEVFAAVPDERGDELVQENAHEQRKAQLREILSKLDERKRQIIMARFGLAAETEPLTLQQVGEQFGVTKERVRQIEARTLQELRRAAIEAHIEVDGAEEKE